MCRRWLIGKITQGSFDEINEKLSSFGITNIQHAVSHFGDKKREKHKEQLKTIKAVELTIKNLTPSDGRLIVFVPSSTDVLLGRGKPIQNHPGVSVITSYYVRVDISNGPPFLITHISCARFSIYFSLRFTFIILFRMCDLV